MALFSRRKKQDPTPTSDEAQPAADRAVDSSAASEPAPETAAVSTPEAEHVPEVNISVSTFQGTGDHAPGSAPLLPPPITQEEAVPEAPRPAVPASAPRSLQGTGEAPPQTETVPGLRDNVLLQQALANVPDQPEPHQIVEVLRQFLQSITFLRVRGDARALIEANQPLPLAVGKAGEQQFLLAYSSGAALQEAVTADGDANSSVMGQPAYAIIQHALAGDFTGILLDGASPTGRAILPRALLEQVMVDADPEFRLKTLMAISPRTPDVATRVGEVLADAPFWVAASQKPVEGIGEDRVAIAEARSPQGERFIQVFSHPLEVEVLQRGDRPVRFRAADLAKALLGDPGLSGVIVDAAGPWIRLNREDLAPVLALAE